MTILTAEQGTLTVDDRHFTVPVTPRSDRMTTATRPADECDPCPMRHRRVRQTPRDRVQQGTAERVIAPHLDDILPAGDLPNQLLTDLDLRG